MPLRAGPLVAPRAAPSSCTWRPFSLRPVRRGQVRCDDGCAPRRCSGPTRFPGWVAVSSSGRGCSPVRQKHAPMPAGQRVQRVLSLCTLCLALCASHSAPRTLRLAPALNSASPMLMCAVPYTAGTVRDGLRQRPFEPQHAQTTKADASHEPRPAELKASMCTCLSFSFSAAKSSVC